jgi:hypothetical protein
MKTTSFKIIVTTAALLVTMAMSAQALTINAGEELTATLTPTTEGFGTFSFFYGLNGWDNYDDDNEIFYTDVADYFLYAPDGSTVAASSEMTWLEWLTPKSIDVRADFNFTANYDFLTLRLIVNEGWLDFNDNFSHPDSGQPTGGVLASSYYENGTRSVDTTLKSDIYSEVTASSNGAVAAVPTPEPATWILLAAGMMGLALARKKKTFK